MVLCGGAWPGSLWGGPCMWFGRPYREAGVTSQQLTYGVVSEGVFAESLQKFCGNSPWKVRGRYVYCARKGCGNSAESLRKVAENCLQ